jgi:hypothetical protein
MDTMGDSFALRPQLFRQHEPRTFPRVLNIPSTDP